MCKKMEIAFIFISHVYGWVPKSTNFDSDMSKFL